jgi:SAM-dependent methyltransferase
MESSGFLRDAAIAAAGELGVFEALRGEPKSLAQVASMIGAEAGQRRLGALMHVLAALGVIVHDRSSTVARFAALGEVPALREMLRAGWGLAADVIRRDQPLPIERGEGGAAELRLHHHLASAGAAAAAELVAQVLDGRSLLDLGAGAGAYSRAFVAGREDRRATLVDTPEILALAADWLGPLASRARFVAGDAATVDAGAGYDAVLLANLLHLHGPTVCAKLVAAAAGAVAPGGVVVIKDLRVDDDRAGPIEGLLFALNMALYTDAGDVYSTGQLRAWLVEAGLVEVTENRLAAAPDAIVVTARRRSASAASRTPCGSDSAESTVAHIGSEPAAHDVEMLSADAAESTGEIAESAVASAASESAGGGDAGPGAAAQECDVVRVADSAESAGREAVARQLDAALAQTAHDAWRALVADGAAGDGAAASPPVLAFPSALRGFLASAVELEREAGLAGDAAAAERADQLVRHYTDAMPRMRIAQLASIDEPGATLFHTALDWPRMPRLDAALRRLFGVLEAAGAATTPALGAPSADAFCARTPTLAALYERTHYGGFMPLLYGFPADLAYMHARGAADGLDVVATIDRYLTAPIIHELCHFAPGRTALSPPHLDECVAGWLGVHVHPELAYPAEDRDDALYAAPWLSQVGQAIARAFGISNLVRAHASGDLAALPVAFVTAAAELGWQDWCARRTLHFLSDTFDPAPWVALAFSVSVGHTLAGETLTSLAATPLSRFAPPADPDFDRAIVEDALRGMCLTSSQVAGSFRTRTRLPDGPITIDALACSIVAPRRGEFDPVVPRYWLPPSVGTRITATGRAGYQLQLDSLSAIPAAASAIHRALPAAAHSGFTLH